MDPGWFVAPIMEKIINTGFHYLKGQCKWQTGMKEELQRLRNIYPKVKAVVFASREAQSREQNPHLNQWLWQLRDAIDEADDVLDEFEYINHKRQVTKSKKQRKVRSIMKSIKKRLVKIVKRALQIDPNLKKLEEAVKKLEEVSTGVNMFLHLLEIAKPEQQEQQQEFFKTRETGSLPKNVLIGRDKDKDFVLQWLKKPSNEDETTFHSKFSLLSIVGHGGMGKTTLLQHVYDEMRKEFDLKIWVCVSNNFDPKKVIADMLEYLKSKRPRADSLATLQESLKSEVMYKKFILVLDDIWEEDEGKWENLLAPLAYGSLGSKILITTRMYSVVSMIAKLLSKKEEDTILRLEGLEEDKCLQLLNSYAFGNVEHTDDHKHLRSITAQIVKKLSGSPLAAKVIGGVLNSSLDKRHWLNILNSDIASAESGQDGLWSILRLSYIFLPKHLQNCFAFCSIFPQDHMFDKDDLVRMWIALGFIQSSANQEETMEDIGGRYFDVLVKKSFFDEHRMVYALNITDFYFELHDHSATVFYKMHDLLHELAQFVSSQECFRVMTDKELHFKIPDTIRHLSVKTKNLKILKQIGEFKRLRSLFVSITVGNEEIVDALTKILQSSRSIRLLHIFCESLRLTPEAIKNLVHLRYLRIFGVIQLSSSLCNLYHLQFIIFQDTIGTSPNDLLPREMNNLFNLRYLESPKDFLDGMHRIGKLHSLQELNGFSVKNEVGYSIQELEHMNELRRLRIKLLENVKDVEQACKAKLCDKRNLTDLSFEWGDVSISNEEEVPREYNEGETLRNIVDIDIDERVLDNLHPHSSLKKLRIHSFMGARSPIWLNNADLMSNLEYIQLDNCLEWQTLPPFGKLPFLKSLYLRNMPKAKTIDYKYHRNEKDHVFPSLELLHIKKLDALEDWFDATITDDCFFPCLIVLHLEDCPNLNELPCLPPKLKALMIFNIGWKTLSFRSISKSIPLVLLLVRNCPNITCISLADNITRFAALRALEFQNCPNLISLGGHQEAETTQNCQLTLDQLCTNNLSMLLMEPLRSIASLQELFIIVNDELVSFPIEVEQWFLQVSSSLSKLSFVSLKSLRSLPSSLESLSSLKFLVIYDVPLLQQLPDLPSSLEFLLIKECHEELKQRYDVISGFDRGKLGYIPYVYIS